MTGADDSLAARGMNVQTSVDEVLADTAIEDWTSRSNGRVHINDGNGDHIGGARVLLFLPFSPLLLLLRNVFTASSLRHSLVWNIVINKYSRLVVFTQKKVSPSRGKPQDFENLRTVHSKVSIELIHSVTQSCVQ